MIKLLLIYILFPLVLYSGNIGLCGGKLFPQRQKMIDNLIFQLNEADENKKDIYKKRLIDDFGYIGIENLIRYKENSLNDIFLDLLDHDDFYVKFKSLYALRHYKKENVSSIIPFLNSTNLYLKDMAVSSLTEIGDKNLLPVLEQYLETETNEYIKSSLKYAIQKINKDLKLTFPDFDFGLEKEKLVKYRYYKFRDKIDGYKERFSQLFLKKDEPPLALSFTPPIIGYWEEFHIKGKRISFGAGGGYRKHVGDDCGWFKEGNSVYAIGDGVIRIIHHSPDWGFLIVIEHKLKNEEYLCSVYGHLSKEIYLKAGDIVKKGDKIGTIGLSYSIENGGYGAHVHFGISKGRWLKSKYNHARNISIVYDNKERKVKEYKITEEGVELIFEGGIKIKLSDNLTRNQKRPQKGISNHLFWLKGYEFSRDVDRLWLDPQEFLKEYK